MQIFSVTGRALRRLPVLCVFSAFAAFADESGPYQVDFDISCDAGVQQKFNAAVTLLHSFEYPETTRMFAEIIAQDRDCAMARWGAAMSIWHPLWAPPTEKELEAGASVLADVDTMRVTDRERGYLDAIGAFFSSTDTTTHLARASAYEDEMRRVYQDNLDDPEAAVFYALALLATQDPRDKSYQNQFKAAGLLNWVAESERGHPGVMHYLIHSYDYPGLAHLALNVARSYAAAAPNSAHAQHMPSHIFTRLGLWDLSLLSNHDSTRSAAEYTRRANLPGHYDEGLHSIDYLMYAMMQTARDEEARKVLVTLADIKRTDTENFKVAFTYAATPARYVLERRQWEDASKLELIRKDFAWEDFGWARSIHHFARGLGAARSGQLEAARDELRIIEAIRDELPATTLPYWREEVQVHADSVRSWILLAEGEKSAAMVLASQAANREDAVDKHPVTPGEVLPARELYADMLYEIGYFSDALDQYEAVLQSSPNRLNALVGAANAAMSAGKEALAAQFTNTIREQIRSGDRRRPSLRKFSL